MVTHNATILEQHLLLASELPMSDYHHEPPPQHELHHHRHHHHQHQQQQQQQRVQQGKTCKKRGVIHNKEDPMSHRIIEKRRRDRMNNCLADLSRLIPADYLKKGRGRIEKTEIIEMAIKHMKHLQVHACRQGDTCELAHQQQSQEERTEQHPKRAPIVTEHYRLGYQECLSEAMHFLVEVEGFFAGDPLCVQLINHLQKHCDKILKGDRLNFPRVNNGETTSTSSGSSGSGSGEGIPLGASGLSSGSPGSGSSSDSSGHTENRDSGIGSGLPLPGSHGSAEDNGYEDGIINLSSTSQLREMLTSPKLSAMSIPPGEKNQQASLILHHRLQRLAHSPAGLCPSGGTGDQGGGSSAGSVASLYKFKNNIKQRFSAEHNVEDGENNGDVVAGHVSRSYDLMVSRKRHNLDVGHDHEDSKSTLMLNMLRRRDSDTCSVSSLPHSPQPPSATKYPRIHSPEAARSPSPPHRPLSSTSYGVPIFALDYKGSYYVPLTLDMEVLAPYFVPSGFGQDVGSSSSPLNIVLHPVTISVNFQHVNQHRMVQTLPQRHRHLGSGCAPVSWKTESQEFMPKWPVCSTDRV